MGLISYLKQTLDIGPHGPVFGVAELEFRNKEYWKHVKCAQDAIRAATTSLKRHTLDVKPNHDEVRPYELMGKISHAWRWNIESWIDDEFIPKIRKFSKSNRYPVTSKYNSIFVGTYDKCREATRHREAAREHADKIVEALHFFLCDERSPFDQKASLDNGRNSPRDLVRWYIEGKHIVQANYDRIDDALKRLIKYAS